MERRTAEDRVLIARASGVLVVGRLGKTSRDSAARLRDQLSGLGASALGVVANEVNVRSHGYYYGYGDDIPGKTTANGRDGSRDRVEGRVGS